MGAAIGFGYWYYHNVSTHTIREENFSVELPRSLEKATTIDYAAQSSDGTVKANGKYADVNSDFQYMILDYSSLAGKLNGYYVKARSGTEYKASEIGKGYTLAHIEKTQKKLKYNSISRNYRNTLKPKDGGLHL